ncbi:hypothetical protein [Myxococcus sp. AS-1-15]|uniref:hypothetical protein n=1 Tax=Myxococcus sp. AS-1-15 TaxID=2874600 RepID=UPI001CC02187|nr:hypothetical protein [Myxococcus sp. AS-1-15]
MAQLLPRGRKYSAFALKALFKAMKGDTENNIPVVFHLHSELHVPSSSMLEPHLLRERFRNEQPIDVELKPIGQRFNSGKVVLSEFKQPTTNQLTSFRVVQNDRTYRLLASRPPSTVIAPFHELTN